jgi:hypothetical protein
MAKNDPSATANTSPPSRDPQEAKALADQARELYQRIEKEFEAVPEAQESLNAAKRVLAALEPKPSEFGPFSAILVGVLGLGVWGAIGLGIAAVFSPGARNIWREWWIWILAAFVLTGVLLALASAFDKYFARKSTEARQTVVTFLLVIPLITVAMMALIGFGARHVTLAAQLIIILVTALLPAITYYLFLATRRPSILNEYIVNLSRLGLLGPRSVPRQAPGQEGSPPVTTESEEERLSRVESYFQRFEAIYGTLRFETGQGSQITRQHFVERLMGAVKQGSGVRIPQATISLGDIFHANLIIPIGLVTILTTLGWLLVLQPSLSDIQTGDDAGRIAMLVPKHTAVNFAFLGAYFFGIQMLFRRFVRRDLGPNAYFAFGNRIILAVIAVWLVAVVYPAFPDEASVASRPAPAAAKASEPAADAKIQAPEQASGAPSGPAGGGAKAGLVEKAASAVKASLAGDQSAGLFLLAFVIGVFPRVLWQFLSSGATKLFRVKLVLPSVEAKQPLSELDGLTVWHEARLEEEDVENVPNMASVDVVELMLHTQIPVERLVTWIDQAILYTALGSGGDATRDKLREFALRTATQVLGVFNAGGTEGKALETAVGADHIRPLVVALQKEANFDLVRAWRQV